MFLTHEKTQKPNHTPKSEREGVSAVALHENQNLTNLRENITSSYPSPN